MLKRPVRNLRWLAAVIMTGIFLYARARSAGAGMINEAAPVVVLRNLAGKTVSLGDLKGKVVFVDFWASWCGPCKQELPEINRFITKYKDSDAVVLAVNIDKTRSNVDEFLSKIQNISNKMLIVLDPDAKVVASYNARMMPTSFIIDKTGVVRYIHFGYRENDPDTWAEEVEGLLKQ